MHAYYGPLTRSARCDDGVLRSHRGQIEARSAKDLFDLGRALVRNWKSVQTHACIGLRKLLHILEQKNERERKNHVWTLKKCNAARVRTQVGGGVRAQDGGKGHREGSWHVARPQRGARLGLLPCRRATQARRNEEGVQISNSSRKRKLDRIACPCSLPLCESLATLKAARRASVDNGGEALLQLLLLVARLEELHVAQHVLEELHLVRGQRKRTALGGLGWVSFFWFHEARSCSTVCSYGM